MNRGAALVLLLLLTGHASAQTRAAEGVGTLTVRVVGFKHAKGTAMIGLTTEKGFLASSGAARARSVPIRDGEATVIFEDVPYGSYAVQAYHDENGNRRLDRSLLGAPSEPYGFSNDARRSFGPPSYREAEFTLSSHAMTLEIRVR